MANETDRDDESRRASAKKPRASQLPADRPEFPKPLVRLTAQADGPGGYGCEVRLVGDSAGVGSAKDEGYAEVDLRAGVLALFQEYPKWLYHADGRRQVVWSLAEAAALDGYGPIPLTDPETEPTPVPPPVAQATALAPNNRPPVPADRG